MEIKESMFFPLSECRKDDKGVYRIHAAKKTNAFMDAISGRKIFDLPFFFLDVNRDFIFKANITPEFKSLFDAGCLFAYDSKTKWIKCAFENTDNGYPAAVAVITDKYSDDATGQRIEEPSLWMQIVRKGNNWAIHFSRDGKQWKMFRYFHMKMSKRIKVGITAQCPTGESCDCSFESVILENRSLNKMRLGDS